MTRRKQLMDFQIYRKAIDNNSYIENVELFNWGEPLLHPQITEFVAYAARRGIKSYLVTNATLLDSEMARGLVRSGLDRITFSIDDVDENFERIRGYSYQKVMDNVTNFIEIARAWNPHMIIGISPVVSEYNSDNVKTTLEKLASWKADSVTLNPCVTYESPRRDRRCQELYRSVVILSNGDIVPCCGDYDGALAFGSIIEQPDLRRHYNNSIMRELRKHNGISEAMPEICSKCTVANWPA